MLLNKPQGKVSSRQLSVSENWWLTPCMNAPVKLHIKKMNFFKTLKHIFLQSNIHNYLSALVMKIQCLNIDKLLFKNNMFQKNSWNEYVYQLSQFLFKNIFREIKLLLSEMKIHNIKNTWNWYISFDKFFWPSLF